MNVPRGAGELYDATTGARLYTVREAARLIGYHPFSLYRLVCQGKLRHRRLGAKTLLFSREDLVRYRELFERRRPAKGRPMPAAEPLPPLTAELAAVVGEGERKETWGQFRWESIPLIRATLDRRYGRRLRGLRISVRGGEGDAWKVVYSAPKL
jgi:excisionase family DNA binding protein